MTGFSTLFYSAKPLLYKNSTSNASTWHPYFGHELYGECVYNLQKRHFQALHKADLQTCRTVSCRWGIYYTSTYIGLNWF